MPTDLSPDHPLSQLDASSEMAMDAAYEIMRRSYCGRISTLHLLLGLLENESNEAAQALRQCGVDIPQLKAEALAARTNDNELATGEKRLTPAAKRVLERAKNRAIQQWKGRISPLHLLLSLLPQQPTLWEDKTFGKDLEDDAAALLAPWRLSLLALYPYRRERPGTRPYRPLPRSGSTAVLRFLSVLRQYDGADFAGIAHSFSLFLVVPYIYPS